SSSCTSTPVARSLSRRSRGLSCSPTARSRSTPISPKGSPLEAGRLRMREFRSIRRSGTWRGPSLSGRIPDRRTVSMWRLWAAPVRAGRATSAAPEGLGMYYAWLGDVEGSLQWYGAAYRAVQPRFLRSGLFDRVRNDARFQEGIARLTARNRARLEEAIVQARSPKPQP